jgi:hypothetical protein
MATALIAPIGEALLIGASRVYRTEHYGLYTAFERLRWDFSTIALLCRLDRRHGPSTRNPGRDRFFAAFGVALENRARLGFYQDHVLPAHYGLTLTAIYR